MPTTKQLTAYARVLLQKGLNLQKGQTLVINAPVESHDFVALLTKEAYTAGAAQVVCNWRSDDLARLRYEHEDLQYFESLPDWRRDFSLYYYHKKAAFLSLISANPYLMDGIDTHKIFAQQKAQNEALKEYIDGMMASKTTWLVAAVPSAVWAKLLYPDDTIQHAGVVIGFGGVAGHTFIGLHEAENSYFHRAMCAQDYSAVTAACLMVKKSIYEEVDGLDESFTISLNDVDLCLKIREKGYLNIFTPFAELYHYESKTRGMEEGEKLRRYERECALFRDKWKEQLDAGDPYYNPNFSLDYSDFTLRF